MKTKLPWVLVLVLGAALAFTWVRAPHPASGHPLPEGEGKAKARRVLYWVDSMHPAYRSDKPGKAPDCGMDLTPVYEGDANAALTIPAQRQQLIGLQTGAVERRAIGKTIRTNARITADETRLAKVTTKFDGYIQKLYVDFTGQPVRSGQPLFTIYSPDLLSAQQEYLLALHSAVPVPGLLEAARDRLRLWDISDADIRALEKSGTPKTSLTIHSPASGVVTNKTAIAGARATAGEALYEIANLDRVWALADVYESELPFVKAGAPATVTVNGSTFRGRVAFIAPVVDEATRTVKVRIEIDNRSGALKPDMFADATIEEPQRQALVVPASAVLQTGTRNVVFVVNGTAVESRDVEIGSRDDSFIEIRSGVTEGEKVAAQANFLIDSESRLRKEIAR